MGLHRSKNITAARRTADEWFGKYIRKSHAENGRCECVTCGKVEDWKKVDAGHCLEKMSFPQVRYNETNVHPQCKGCNMAENGKAAIHAQAITELYGTWQLEELIRLCGQPHINDKERVMRIAREYKRKYEELC